MGSLTAVGVGVEVGGARLLAPTDLSLLPGSLIGLVGPNGAGKTTLLRALAQVIDYEGEVLYNQRAVEQMGALDRARKIAYLPQRAQAFWPLPVRELVSLGRLPHHRVGQPLDDADDVAVAKAIARVELTELADRPMDQLSGGEQARALLARALAVEAQVLLVDEPTASLDPYHQLLVMETLADYAADGGLVVAVLHDLPLAARYCPRLVLLNEGHVLADGEAEAVLNDANLATCYRIESLRGSDGGATWILPWARSVEAENPPRV